MEATMRRILPAGITVLLLSAFPAHTDEQTTVLAVENMTCASCPYIVKQTLVSVPGVIRAEVSLQEETAAVTFEDTVVDLAAITTATAAAGYPSRPLISATDQ
jgi:mercuric ion binding protein